MKLKNLIATAIACGAFAGLVVTAPALAASTPLPSSHEAMVEKGSNAVMPFDLTRTMHVFDPNETGGVQTVLVHDGDPHGSTA